MSLDKIPTSRGMTPHNDIPRDRLAARVVYGNGIHWAPDARSITLRHTREFPLGMKAPLDGWQASVVGVRFGRMTCLGVAAHRQGGNEPKALYVCRCACGAYEHRTSKAIRNPKNSGDACAECRTLAQRRRHDWKHRTGEWREVSDFLGTATPKDGPR